MEGFLQEGDQGSQQSRVGEQFEQSSEKCDEHNFLSIVRRPYEGGDHLSYLSHHSQ